MHTQHRFADCASRTHHKETVTNASTSVSHRAKSLAYVIVMDVVS